MIDPATLKAAAPLISKIATALSEPTKGMAIKTKEKLEIKFRKGFEGYIEKQLERASSIKTIISSSTPLLLKDIYVNLYLAAGPKAFRDEDFLTSITKYRHVIFTATAGAGKSMLMRYLYLKFLETQTDRLPVFVELRDLNRDNSTTLMAFMREKIAEYIDGFSDQHLKYAIDTGRLVLFLDGFDEIDHDKRKEREKELNVLASRNKNLLTFISSRPAETFANWEKFFVFDVQPFTEKQVELLIKKIPYDNEIKQLFLKKLSEGLYTTHREFLTNPLLTIMMLITLEQFAEVPAKVHLFYEYAFEALFGRHDVTKGGFQRKRHTTLALDDFKRLFSYFCMITYARKLLTFSSDALLGFIQQSILSSQIITDKVQFRNDLTESTCMLVMDGLDYTFSHRSFQEYFTAYFLSRVKVDEIERIVPKLVEINGVFDNVLKMLSEMNSEKFEESWSLPALERMCNSVQNIDAKQKPIEYCEAVIGKIVVYFEHGDRIMVTTAGNDSTGQTRMALYSIYDQFDKIHSILKRQKISEPQLIKRIQSGELLGNDPRFADIRNKPTNRVSIALSADDEGWFKATSFGGFVAVESELLPKLRDEVRDRVAARNKGLARLFP